VNGDVSLIDVGFGRSTFSGATSFFSTPGIDFGFSTNFGIPVGIGGPGFDILIGENPFLTQGIGLPPMVSLTGPSTIAPIPGPVDRRDIPPVQAVVSPLLATSWFDYWEKKEAGLNVYPPGTVIPNVDRQLFVEPQTGDDDMADWGGVIDQVYKGIDTVVGGILPGGVPFGSSVPQTLVYGPQQFDAAAPLPAPVTAVEPMVQAITTGRCGIPKGYHISCVCGVIKLVKNKRRRKMLFTQSESVQLASLLQIAGNGAIAKTWIATHKT